MPVHIAYVLKKMVWIAEKKNKSLMASLDFTV